LKITPARFALPLLALHILLSLCPGPCRDARAQDSTSAGPRGDSLRAAGISVVVGEVLISGNEETKSFVILREMSLRPGEKITPEKLDYDRERIYSLRLFNRVQVRAVAAGAGTANVIVEVNERWYIFPFPVLGRRDRDWSKVFYGAGVVHNNFRGRNEKLFASLVLGYDPAVSLFYRNSFLDEEGAWFMDAKISYSRVRNRSPEVEALFGEYEERHFTVQSNVGTRLGRHHSVWASAGYRFVHVPNRSTLTTVAGDGKDNFPIAGLGYLYDTRDLIEYPSMGTMIGISVMKSGLPGKEPDFFRVATDVRHFLPLPGGLVLAGRLFTDQGGGKRIPVYGRVYFGYSERIRGHFTAVAEGENLAGAAVEIHFPVLAPRYLSVDPLPNGFNLWRFGIGAALFADEGTTWFRDGKFSVANMAKGYGVGIHFLLPYSAVLRLEYGWNEFRRGEFILDLGAAL